MSRFVCTVEPGGASGFVKGSPIRPERHRPRSSRCTSSMHTRVASSPAVESLGIHGPVTQSCFIMQMHAGAQATIQYAQHDYQYSILYIYHTRGSWMYRRWRSAHFFINGTATSRRRTYATDCSFLPAILQVSTKTFTSMRNAQYTIIVSYK